VTAAVAVENEEMAAFLWSIGVKDCKNLSDEQVLMIADQIKRLGSQNYCVTPLIPETYNEQYKQHMNLNTLLARMHASTIESLLVEKFGRNMFNAAMQAVPANITVLVDQFSANEDTLKDNMLPMGSRTKLVQRTKAESNVAVAAASILARAEYLRQLNKLSETYNIALPKGATDVVPAAQTFVNEYSGDELGKVAKLHFKTTIQVVLSH